MGVAGADALEGEGAGRTAGVKEVVFPTLGLQDELRTQASALSHQLAEMEAERDSATSRAQQLQKAVAESEEGEWDLGRYSALGTLLHDPTQGCLLLGLPLLASKDLDVGWGAGREFRGLGDWAWLCLMGLGGDCSPAQCGWAAEWSPGTAGTAGGEHTAQRAGAPGHAGPGGCSGAEPAGHREGAAGESGA